MTVTRGLRVILAATALLLIPLAGPSAAAAAPRPAPEKIVRIYHLPPTPTLVQGSGLGAVRTFYIPLAVNGKAADGQVLVGTLTTVAVGLPGDQELRSSDLSFVLGSPDDQVVIGGVSAYPAAGATLAPGTRTERPIVGGTGAYRGARGYVVSINNGPAGWEHVLHIRR